MTLLSDRFATNHRLLRAAENDPAIRQGESDHAAVTLLQQAFVVLGFHLPKSTKKDGFMDGIYGDETRQVVEAFQVRHIILGANGRPDGVVGKKTLDKLDECLRRVGNRTLLPPLLVRQTDHRCWAAAIESLTEGRHTVASLVQQFSRHPMGQIDYPTDVDRVFKAVGIIGGQLPLRDSQVLGLALLTDLTANRRVFLCAKRHMSIAHCVTIYGVDGVRGSTVLIRYMDPLEGYRMNELEPILRNAESIVLGRMAK